MRFSVGLSVLGAVVALVPPAHALETGKYVEACVADPSWADEADLFTGSAVTPKMFCECLAGRYKEEKLSQSDVDFLTKLRLNTLTDDEMQNYETAEDLFAADETFNEACQTKLGLKSGRGAPGNDDSTPDDDGPDEGGAGVEAPALGVDPDDPVGDEPTDDEPGSGPD